jgi:hypothetical protein
MPMSMLIARTAQPHLRLSLKKPVTVIVAQYNHYFRKIDQNSLYASFLGLNFKKSQFLEVPFRLNGFILICKKPWKYQNQPNGHDSQDTGHPINMPDIDT